MGLRDRAASRIAPLPAENAGGVDCLELAEPQETAREQATQPEAVRDPAPAGVSREQKAAKKAADIAQKIADLPPSKVPSGEISLKSDDKMGVSVEKSPEKTLPDFMTLRTPEQVNLAHLKVHREANDAYEALVPRLPFLEAEKKRELKRSITIDLGEDGDDFDHEFDLQGEINAQLRLLRTLRSKAETENLSTRELKETLTGSTSLIKMLIEEQMKVVNIDRLRAIEHAAVVAIRTLPQDAQDAFFKDLEGRIDGYDRQKR